MINSMYIAEYNFRAAHKNAGNFQANQTKNVELTEA